MQEQINAARAAVENLNYSPAWAAAGAVGAVLDAVEAMAREVEAIKAAQAPAVEPEPAPAEGEGVA